MRIAMIAPLEIRVPPIAYGGTELVVSLLTEELASRGHDITLFASGDSISQARLESVCPHSLRGSDGDKGILNLLNVVSCLQRADQFDIIHNHTTVEGMSTAGLVNTPVLTTLHGDLNGDFRTLFTHYKGWYNTISRSAQSLLPEKERFAGVIYNAIDCASYPFNGGERDDYLLYLSRISPEKGTHLAIQVARKLGRRLIIAGNVDEVDQQYFQSQLSPQIDGKLIQFVGEADYYQKRQLLCQAQCLVAAINWPEPFGLFMVEAMACGTPVVALKRGSAPEVVCHGVTGFVVNTLEEMMDAIGQVNQIEPKCCREYVELRFDVPRMADDYMLAYQRILEAEGKWSRSVVVPDLSSKEMTQDSHLGPTILEGQSA
jgi:glycosyltransferase involved in cell wall biosynthesis